jgi:hypothetical protein
MKLQKSTEKLKSSFLELVNFEDTEESAFSTKCIESEKQVRSVPMDLILRDIVWNGLKITTPQNFDYKGTLKLSLVREQNFKFDLAKLDLLSIKLKLLNLYQFYNILQIFCYFFKTGCICPDMSYN